MNIKHNMKHNTKNPFSYNDLFCLIDEFNPYFTRFMSDWKAPIYVTELRDVLNIHYVFSSKFSQQTPVL